MKRPYGWKHTYPVAGGLRVWLDRFAWDASPLMRVRSNCEQMLLAYDGSVFQFQEDTAAS